MDPGQHSRGSSIDSEQHHDGHEPARSCGHGRNDSQDHGYGSGYSLASLEPPHDAARSPDEEDESTADPNNPKNQYRPYRAGVATRTDKSINPALLYSHKQTDADSTRRRSSGATADPFRLIKPRGSPGLSDEAKKQMEEAAKVRDVRQEVRELPDDDGNDWQSAVDSWKQKRKKKSLVYCKQQDISEGDDPSDASTVTLSEHRRESSADAADDASSEAITVVLRSQRIHLEQTPASVGHLTTTSVLTMSTDAPAPTHNDSACQSPSSPREEKADDPAVKSIHILYSVPLPHLKFELQTQAGTRRVLVTSLVESSFPGLAVGDELLAVNDEGLAKRSPYAVTQALEDALRNGRFQLTFRKKTETSRGQSTARAATPSEMAEKQPRAASSPSAHETVLKVQVECPPPQPVQHVASAPRVLSPARPRPQEPPLAVSASTSPAQNASVALPPVREERSGEVKFRASNYAPRPFRSSLDQSTPDWLFQKRKSQSQSILDWSRNLATRNADSTAEQRQSTPSPARSSPSDSEHTPSYSPPKATEDATRRRYDLSVQLGQLRVDGARQQEQSEATRLRSSSPGATVHGTKTSNLPTANGNPAATSTLNGHGSSSRPGASVEDRADRSSDGAARGPSDAVGQHQSYLAFRPRVTVTRLRTHEPASNVSVPGVNRMLLHSSRSDDNRPVSLDAPHCPADLTVVTDGESGPREAVRTAPTPSGEPGSHREMHPAEKAAMRGLSSNNSPSGNEAIAVSHRTSRMPPADASAEDSTEQGNPQWSPYAASRRGVSAPSQPFGTMPQLCPSGQSASQRHDLFVSGRRNCECCGRELGNGAAMVIESLGLCFHAACFRCSVCRAPLNNPGKSADVRVRNNQPHCSQCYTSAKGDRYTQL